MKFYFSGQRTFGNRGCEAIVRSTVALLAERFSEIQVLVPSDDIVRDKRQWPNAAESGVHFVPAFVPSYTLYWVHLQRLPLPVLKRAGWPFPIPGWLKEQIASVDAVLSIGGDNYSLDYRIPSLVIAVDALAKRLGKPLILWGASVGPFEREPDFVPAIQSHLGNFDMICARESVTFDYLTSTLGLNNVIRTVDPAFALKKEHIDTAKFWPTIAPNGVLGLNVSPLIENYRTTGQDLRAEVISFIRDATSKYGLGVLLIPHVTPLNGDQKNNDEIYMKPLLDACSDMGGVLRMMPSLLNAAQTKDVLSALRFFIGARTHATIGALSSGVPTISIAYSVKARGINRDLFGNESLVLPTPSVSASTLSCALVYLLDNESSLRQKLTAMMPEYRITLTNTTEQLRQFVTV